MFKALIIGHNMMIELYTFSVALKIAMAQYGLIFTSNTNIKDSGKIHGLRLHNVFNYS